MKPLVVILEYGVGEGTLNPTGHVPTSNMSKTSSRHMSKIAQVYREFCNMDLDIVSLPITKAKEWLDANHHKVWAMSASVGKFLNDDFLDSYDIYRAISSGNEGARDVIDNPGWVRVGAVDQNHRPTSYSSYNPDEIEVDYVGVAGYRLTFNYDGTHTETFNGTSYACPYHVAQVLNMMWGFYKAHGRKPRTDEIKATLERYVTDIHVSGEDHRTGKGLYQYKEGELYMLFKDEHLIADWAKASMEKAKLKGILKGDLEGNVNPQSQPTLEQLMVILDRSGALGK